MSSSEEHCTGSSVPKPCARCSGRGGEHMFQPVDGLGEEMMPAGVWNRG